MPIRIDLWSIFVNRGFIDCDTFLQHRIGVVLVEAHLAMVIFKLNNDDFVWGRLCDVEYLILIVINECEDLIHV